MDVSVMPTAFAARLPDWVLDEIANDPPKLPDVADRMRLVLRLADRNHREGTGGPFAALISDAATGEIVSAGVNLVLATDLSSLHAEVVAICLAQARLGSWDLGGPDGRSLELAVNWRPCAMCYGAVLWSGAARLVIAGEGDECEQLTGFDEGPMRDDWREQLIARGLAVRVGVLREQAVHLFRTYASLPTSLVYNPRRTASPASPTPISGLSGDISDNSA